MKTVVEVWSHDSWDGVTLAYTKKYAHHRSAVRAVKQINGENTATVVPEHYYTANIKGEGSQAFRFR